MKHHIRRAVTNDVLVVDNDYARGHAFMAVLEFIKVKATLITAEQLFAKLDWDGARPLRVQDLQGRVCRFATKPLVVPGKQWRSPINRQSHG